ncbi:MAG: TonB-dependent receptor, partial [Alphaproteobacteria bacterium]
GLELINVTDVAPDETRATIGPGGIDLGTDLDNDALFGIGDTPGSEFFGRFAAGGDFFGYIDPDGKGWRFSGDFAFKDQGFTRTWGVDGRIVWELSPDITLTSVTDFKSYDKLLFIDVDAAPVNQSANYAGVDATSVTQEVRLNGTSGRLTWVAGLYYLNIDDDADNGLKFPQGSVVPGAPFDLGVDARLKTNSYSGFVHLQYDVTDTLDFVLGARLIQEKKNYFFQQAIYFTQSSFQIHQGTPILIGPVFGAGGPEPFTAKTSDTLWAGVARIEYKPTDAFMWWASVKRGVKAGSFNAQLAGGIPVPNSAIPYRPEVLYSYETGIKSDVLNGLARFNANVFYYDYNDYQSFLFTGVSGVVINADAKYKGAEAEFVVSPVDGLDIRLAGSWIDATVKDVPLRVGGPIIRDVRPNYTPKWQFQSMIAYEWPAFGGLMRVLAEGNYSSNFFYNLRNFDADKFDGYFLLNTRIGWTTEDDRWEVAFRIRNLTQEKAGVQGFDLATLCGCNEISFRPPRWFGLEVRYKR